MPIHPANLLFSAMRPRVLLINNHDSFTWNLAQLLDESGLCDFTVRFIDEISLESIELFDKLIISPGPGIPSEIPLIKEIISIYAGKKSILGICLGHQAIVEAKGGRLLNLAQVVHGIRLNITVTDPSEGLFNGLPGKFDVGLYHSWAADAENLPSCLRITAISPAGVVMAVSHDTYDLKGLQFHPESYMTEFGHCIIDNWLST